jgi:hypothetical protein
MHDMRRYTTSRGRGRDRTAILVVAGWALLVALTSARGPARGANAPASAVASTERLMGTVTAVDTRARTLDLLTGVGYALRIRRVHLPPDLKLEAQRPATTVPALAPGSIVRVEFRQTASGAVATTVEVLQNPPRKEQP